MMCPKCGSTAIVTDAAVDPDTPHTCTSCFRAFNDDDVRRKYGDVPPDVLGEGTDDGEPLLAGEILGWRAWFVCDANSNYRGLDLNRLPAELRIMSTPNGRIPTIFEPGKIMHAQCPSGHVNPPQEGVHCCGFYAARSREHLVSLGYNNYRLGAPSGDIVVIGKVALAGKVIPGDQGWRAAQAWAHELYVPYDKWQVVKSLQTAYGIPVHLDKTLSERQGY